MTRFGFALLVTVCLLALPVTVEAETIGFFTGTETVGTNTLSASALFEYSGNTLTITLSNTGDTDGELDGPATTLTGLFFDLPDGVTLTTVDATATAPLIYQSNLCDPGPCSSTDQNVGGEFAYATGTFGTHLGNSGISSAGYIGTSSGNLNGDDIDDPPAPDGINFGIIAPTGTFEFNPNGGTESVPLVDGTVIFAFTVNGSLSEGDISNVSFQYGTNLAETGFPGGGSSGQGIPEPAGVLLVAPALAIALRRYRHRKTFSSVR